MHPGNEKCLLGNFTAEAEVSGEAMGAATSQQMVPQLLTSSNSSGSESHLIPILHVRKLKPREGGSVAFEFQWYSGFWDSNPGYLTHSLAVLSPSPLDFGTQKHPIHPDALWSESPAPTHQTPWRQTRKLGQDNKVRVYCINEWTSESNGEYVNSAD